MAEDKEQGTEQEAGVDVDAWAAHAPELVPAEIVFAHHVGQPLLINKVCLAMACNVQNVEHL